PESTRWTVKKSRSTDTPRFVLVIAAWIVRLRHVPYVLVALIAVLVVLARFDPQRAERKRQELDQRREMRARDEARHAEAAKAIPSTGIVALDFRRLDFRLPPEADDPKNRARGYAQWLPAGVKSYDGREIT